jgi:hypothetical protein
MLVEVKFVPPPAKVQENGAPAAAAPTAFDKLQIIAPQLVFPKVEGPPILKLPQPPVADPRNE